jgi:hypothetical protein
MQVPAEQSGWFVGHTLPQAPQFALSLCTFAQNGWPASGTHPTSFAGHPPLHLPPAQTSSGLHAVSHAPQCALSVCRLVQIPPSPTGHACWPAPQSEMQLPFEHKLVESQVLPHAPQFAGSLFVSTHTPLHAV